MNVTSFILMCCLLLLGNSFSINAQRACTTPNNVNGNCMPVKDCTRLYNIIQGPKPLPPSEIEFLRKSQCAGVGPIQVCCAPTDLKLNDIAKHPNIKLLDTKRCGPFSTNKIGFGNKTHIEEFPWMALLKYSTPNGDRFQCGGTLINANYVLTAAHCVVTRSTEPLISVRLGEYDTTTDTDCEILEDEEICTKPVQDIGVGSIISHPNYNKPKYANDIALIRLARPANLNEPNVRTICLPTTEALRALPLTKLTVTGWGLTEIGSVSTVLLKADIPAVSNTKCVEQYAQKRVIVKLENTQLCAGGDTRTDSCEGDSGGPLQFPAVLGQSKYVQFGIVSYGAKGCGDTSVPGIYCRVSSYMEWILDNMSS